MLSRDEVLRILKENRQELETFGVKSIALFGSVVRGEAGPESDVDLLVELERGVTLFGFVRLRRRLEEMIGARVDLVMREGLRKGIREHVLAEAVLAA